LHGRGALRGLLPRANVLVLALPSTPETIGLIGRAELDLLPGRAVVVNAGRAASIDERALYEALASHRLLAAGLDVWYRYPESRDRAQGVAPAHFPFHHLDNVVMSPHRAGGLGVGDVEDARVDALAALLNAATRGEPVPNRVDLEAGY
jgi:phosphoglycerate dehydrogenase-like enzyme